MDQYKSSLFSSKKNETFSTLSSPASRLLHKANTAFRKERKKVEYYTSLMFRNSLCVTIVRFFPGFFTPIVNALLEHKRENTTMANRIHAIFVLIFSEKFDRLMLIQGECSSFNAKLTEIQ